MVIVLVYQWGLRNGMQYDKDDVSSEITDSLQEETNRMISLTSDELSQYDINGTQFVSFLFYSNKGRDSVMVVPGPIEFYPNYHFIGYSVENDLVIAFGYDRIEEQRTNQIKQLLSRTYNIDNDEKGYHDFCLQASNNASSCGPVRYKLFELNLPPKK